MEQKGQAEFVFLFTSLWELSGSGSLGERSDWRSAAAETEQRIVRFLTRSAASNGAGELSAPLSAQKLPAMGVYDDRLRRRQPVASDQKGTQLIDFSSDGG
jgi:hypothetical protein